jgi:hypothetical protein
MPAIKAVFCASKNVATEYPESSKEDSIAATEFGLHAAVLIVLPAEHEVAPEREYPEWQLKIHVSPCESNSLQAPILPFSGVFSDASHFCVFVMALLS